MPARPASSGFFCSVITKEYAAARHANQRPCSARVAAPSAASPSADSLPGPGGSPRSVHPCGSVIWPLTPPAQTNAVSARRRLAYKISSRCPFSGWNGWATMTNPKESLDNAALCRLRGYPQLAELPRPAGLGNQAFPHRQRPERAVLEGGPQIVQEPGHAHFLLDIRRGDAVDAGGVRALVACDPGERHDQRRRVVHEIEQDIKPAARIGRLPPVKLCLNPPYP